MRKICKHIQRIMDRFPNEYDRYPCWMIWLVIAGLKTWVYRSLKTAMVLYWNKKAWMEKPSV